MNVIKICKEFKLIDLICKEILFSTNNNSSNNNNEIPSSWDVKEMIISLLNINNKNNSNNFINIEKTINNSDSNNNIIYTFKIELSESSSTPNLFEKLNNKIISFYGIKNNFKFIVLDNQINNSNNNNNKNNDSNNVSDTLIIKNLPKLIFLNYSGSGGSNDESRILNSFKSIWSYFGQIKNLEILKNDIITFDIIFQFSNIKDSLECFNKIKSKKLVYVDGRKEQVINNLEIEFNFNNYLSNENIRKRKFNKELLELKLREKKEKERQEKLKQEEQERLEKENRDRESERIEKEKQEKELQLQIELDQLKAEIEEEKRRIKKEKEEKKKLKLERKRKRGQEEELEKENQRYEMELNQRLEDEYRLKQQRSQQEEERQQQHHYQQQVLYNKRQQQQYEYEQKLLNQIRKEEEKEEIDSIEFEKEESRINEQKEKQLLTPENIQFQIDRLNQWIDHLNRIIVLKSKNESVASSEESSSSSIHSYKMIWQLPSRNNENNYYKSIENKMNQENIYVKGKSIIPSTSKIGINVLYNNEESDKCKNNEERIHDKFGNSTEINLKSKELELKEMILKKRLLFS
ncbi:hypothetical protein DICPUDRAFT_146665 [Dictyostelium purpureum]|uniref:RRM domain-containing protein n=1 Tax=Dictyostelium purpureum TaxID=5786 RepID=F0Z6J7_DICPU|nr:uncharacterized protein DICPUDRAFT_146665 [Dictyostelium purpureum]EGC40504.1 hypothetical protein DICPUDRAFT_146665 [Dictyostelium purpureum]|eukprot:XP_003283051.1 hypothetical protein DICPUDRAFT_146665 [Dictyostelium purpureum]